ncbi:hypothetical protein L1987_01065 [Smallanthus sonchifolius]|uniref:Uncharacterized protein n=1 Tax=Smallanthus sonchifolius TaxID=185202 RepID=A0ACB9K425_9ASTR|nr:hypothetical protein L1987_01065 [Smallanthus sonchifolius]
MLVGGNIRDSVGDIKVDNGEPFDFALNVRDNVGDIKVDSGDALELGGSDSVCKKVGEYSTTVHEVAMTDQLNRSVGVKGFTESEGDKGNSDGSVPPGFGGMRFVSPERGKSNSDDDLNESRGNRVPLLEFRELLKEEISL